MKEDMRIGKLIALLLWVVAAVAAFGCFAENQYSLAFACIFSGLFSGNSLMRGTAERHPANFRKRHKRLSIMSCQARQTSLS